MNSVITPKISDNGCSPGEVKVTVEIKTGAACNFHSIYNMLVTISHECCFDVLILDKWGDGESFQTCEMQ